MGFNFFFAIAVIFALALSGGFLLWYLFKYFSNAKPGPRTIEKDLQDMRKEISEASATLVPWTKEEWPLLSVSLGHHKEYNGMIKRAEGTMQSIYHEPLLVYRYKQYAGGKHSLLLIKTHSFEYVFWKKGEKTEIFKDSEAFGMFDKEGVLLSKDGKREIGKLQAPDENTFIPVVLHDYEVANISNPQKVDSHNPRAFEYLTELADEDQEKLFALTLSYFVKERIPFAKSKAAKK